MILGTNGQKKSDVSHYTEDGAIFEHDHSGSGSKYSVRKDAIAKGQIFNQFNPKKPPNKEVSSKGSEHPEGNFDEISKFGVVEFAHRNEQSDTLNPYFFY